jgi:hypothetical protein
LSKAKLKPEKLEKENNNTYDIMGMVSAPDDVAINREEVYKKKQR